MRPALLAFASVTAFLAVSAPMAPALTVIAPPVPTLPAPFNDIVGPGPAPDPHECFLLFPPFLCGGGGNPRVACVADAVRVTTSLGPAEELSHSLVWAFPSPGPGIPPLPGPFVPFVDTPFVPPPVPQSHADAGLQLAEVSLPNFATTLTARGLHSNCDASLEPNGDFHVFGKGGVAELRIPGVLTLKTVEFAATSVSLASGFGGPAVYMGCHMIEVAALAGEILDVCPGTPPGVFSVSAGLSGVAKVTVWLNEQWGPAFVGGGFTYGGSAVHIRLELAVVGQVDIYVGFVAHLLPVALLGPVWAWPGFPFPGACTPTPPVCVI